MKRSYLSYSLMVSMLLVACGDEESTAERFALEQQALTFAPEGGIGQLQLSAEGDWAISSSVPWVNVSPASGSGDALLTLSADSTLLSEVRQGELRVVSPSHDPLFLQVSQQGYAEGITLGKESLHLAYSAAPDERVFEIPVSTNVEFSLSYDYQQHAPWLKADDWTVRLDRGARPRSTTLRFTWEMNPDPQERSVTIHLLPVEAEAPVATLTITQDAAPRIGDNREGDSLAVVIMHTRYQSMQELEATENMMYWDNVTLWEARDSDLPCPEAIGRIRSLQLMLISTDEGLPQEMSHLRYLEELSVYGNFNAGTKNIPLGTSICQLKHLKRLQVAAYGLVSLPEELKELGGTLEVLDVNSNNFADIPAVLTPENFPALRRLNLSTCRRVTCLDLRNKYSYSQGLGLNISFATQPQNRVRDLFRWDNLEQLALSYNYLEGELPEFHVGEEGVEAWTEADVVAWGGDTIRNLIGKPKILPRTTDLRINLNFFTGALPEWILYHPHLLDWEPDSFIFTTQEKGVSTSGHLVGFTNVPADFDYYYDFYPGYKAKYHYVIE